MPGFEPVTRAVLITVLSEFQTNFRFQQKIKIYGKREIQTPTNWLRDLCHNTAAKTPHHIKIDKEKRPF